MDWAVQHFRPDCDAVGLKSVRDTGIEPVTSSVSGKRSPAELIARALFTWCGGGGDGNRTRVHGFAGRCLTTRPHHQMREDSPRADDGIRTRDPHLGKVMRYQLRHIRVVGSDLVDLCCSRRDEEHYPTAQRIPNHLVRGLHADRDHAGGRTESPIWGTGYPACNLLPRASARFAPSAVPWLSGRASRSHREGRWFDPSRDHQVRAIQGRPAVGCESVQKGNRRRGRRAPVHLDPLTHPSVATRGFTDSGL